MVDGFSCILDFPGEDPRTPLIKGIYQLNPQNLSSTTTAAKDKKSQKKPSPIQTIYKKFILGYTEIEKRRRALEQDLFYVMCNWAV